MPKPMLLPNQDYLDLGEIIWVEPIPNNKCNIRFKHAVQSVVFSYHKEIIKALTGVTISTLNEDGEDPVLITSYEENLK